MVMIVDGELILEFGVGGDVCGVCDVLRVEKVVEYREERVVFGRGECEDGCVGMGVV